jgi:hypothetical protein
VLTQQKAEFRRREADALRTHFADLRGQNRTAATQTSPLDPLRDIKRLSGARSDRRSHAQPHHRRQRWRRVRLTAAPVGFHGAGFLAATLLANVATSFLSFGSLINETALLGSTHWTNRCSSSGQVSLCLVTSNGKTLTSQLTSMPFSSSNLLYLKRPTDFAPTFPLTPASSNASRAADFAGLRPLIGQPLGMIQRLDRREVTMRTSSAASGVNR